MGKSRVVFRTELAPDIYKMTFDTKECGFTGPGQYALIKVGDQSRPYQVCDYDSNRYTIVFRADGRGGGKLMELEYGDEVESITGLGRGFDVDSIPDGAVLVADSMGITEMLELARVLLTRGRSFRAVLGYADKDSIYMVDSFKNICNELEVLTLDGSNGRRGMASDGVRNVAYVCASGSPAMLKALSEKAQAGQFSLSEMMLLSDQREGDFTVEMMDGDVKFSSFGPVFDKNQVRWDTLSVDKWSKSTF